jgi:formylglycine-generating enzyme required for sulfatase activity
MKLAYIPSGEFMMGSPKSEQEKCKREPTELDLESPLRETQHEVEITKGFYLGTFEVTQEEYQAVTGKNPSKFKRGARLPVENVSWDEAKAFCEKLSKKEGKPYRLPSEAEWEYACRAGTQTAYHNGPMISTEQANYLGDEPSAFAQKAVPRLKTTPVGSFAANAWGLHDMHGTVSELCEDCFDEEFEFYRNSPARDPLNTQWAYDRVVRGGSWMHPPLDCRSAARNCDASGGHWIGPSGFQGFRVVLETRQ